jgi:hypothetical protein
LTHRDSIDELRLRQPASMGDQIGPKESQQYASPLPNTAAPIFKKTRNSEPKLNDVAAAALPLPIVAEGNTNIDRPEVLR